MLCNHFANTQINNSILFIHERDKFFFPMSVWLGYKIILMSLPTTGCAANTQHVANKRDVLIINDCRRRVTLIITCGKKLCW